MTPTRRAATRPSTHPPKVRSDAELALVARVRTAALALPETHEVEAWGEPTFRLVGGKMFAMYATSSTHHGSGRPALWIKATPINQALLLADHPTRLFKPPYVGAGGWIGIWLDKRPSWRLVQQLLDDGWRLVAPKRLLSRT